MDEAPHERLQIVMADDNYLVREGAAAGGGFR
jgi:hypothetical protein